MEVVATHSNMTFFSSDEDRKTWETANDQVVNAPHKAHLSHELIAGAAAFEAAKAFNKHKAENGEAPSHEKFKEVSAGLIGAFVDHIVETKGLDTLDKEKAKHEAKKHFNEGLAKHY